MMVAMANGRPGHPDQARRSPAQHAHDRRDAQAEADRQGEGDPRDLRADRAPARHPRDQVGARGPRVRRRCTRASTRRSRASSTSSARSASSYVDEGRRATSPRELEALGIDAEISGPRQALLLDLLEDDEEGPRVQRDLRPHGDARDRRLREGLLRRGRRRPLAVEAAAGPLQGLHRDAEVQHVPVAAHDGDRARGPAAGDPDPHARDAGHGRVRRRRALDLQGGRATARRRPAADGDAKLKWLRSMLDWQQDSQDPKEFMDAPEGRPLRGRGLRLHAQGRGQVAGRRRDAAGLRLRGPHRRRPPLRRREGQRQDRAAALRAASPATSSRS